MEEQAAYTMASSIYSCRQVAFKTNVRKKCAGARCAHAAMLVQAVAIVGVTAPAQATHHQPQNQDECQEPAVS